MERWTDEALTDVQCLSCTAQLSEGTYAVWQLAAQEHAERNAGHVVVLRYVREVRYVAEASHA